MRERLESFVALSAALTGFTEVRLWGSGVAGEHLAVLTEVVPADVVADLLDGTDGPDASAWKKSGLSTNFSRRARWSPSASAGPA